jgi:hypothetical protein
VISSITFIISLLSSALLCILLVLSFSNYVKTLIPWIFSIHFSIFTFIVFTNELQVEPQEKKKKPRGRAYKRLLYNRRFVNVVAGFGKKKGKCLDIK